MTAADIMSTVTTSGVFSKVDLMVFLVMLVGSLIIGVVSAYTSRNNKTTTEYLLGSRQMCPLPVGLSLLGGWVSAISILGNATEVYLHGTQVATSLLGCVLGVILVGRVFLPVLYHLNITSIIEYIQLRFGSIVLRKAVTSCYICLNFFYMGMVLYAPTLALSTVTSLPTWGAMLILGSICTVYITIGGVKAVVYTDVLQTILMFSGVMVVVVICCVDLDGFNNVWTLSQQGDRIQFFNMDINPYQRHTFLSTFVFGCYLMVSNLGFNPSTFQRFASVNSLRKAQGMIVFFLVGIWCLWTVFFLSGLVAFATYYGCDPITAGNIQQPDQIIPYLVMDKLGRFKGLTGLFVAAVYGGVLSTQSSCANSMACVIWEDFLKPAQYFHNLPEEKAIYIVKVISCGAGLMSVLVGLLVEHLGSIFQVAYSVCAAFESPMYGVFLAGLCAPWVNTKGVTVGFISALVFNLWLIVSKLVNGGGSPDALPLSIDYCHLTNTSSISTTNTSFISTTITNNNNNMTDPEYTSPRLYDLSYCYIGVLGLAITVGVASVVSLCTGVIEPERVVKDVVVPECLKLYQWVWNHCHHTTTMDVTPDHSREDIQRPFGSKISNVIETTSLETMNMQSRDKMRTVNIEARPLVL
ncbi:hypothetical protein Pmani_020821 [Petrolisthes manimaculis]|uniref:Uncharacterized protein n=1 Tax=Petrolisthes manimaculis TaxID=1843537 RepID=A0AAE1PHY6_9EUCA|nr:hypothetical protein Pmani_020821 [Petrolisthes manimaculis]